MVCLSFLFETLSITASIGIAALSVGVVAWYILRQRKAALQLRRAAKRYARGDFSNPPQINGPRELADLSEALTQMALQLDSRLSTVVAQRNEMGAVVSSMAEGVITIDNEEILQSLNAAATKLLGLQPAKAIGQPIQAVIRNAGLQAVVRETFYKQTPIQSEITLHATDPTNETVEQSDRFIQVQTALLRDETQDRNGIIVVLHDVTKVRRLESMRRDFVANVSHEIKTPIAAIKAAVENLIDDNQPRPPEAPPENLPHGAGGMPGQHPMAQRFLSIIERQADRMTAIIEDLLSLARIEQGEEAVGQHLEPGKLHRVLKAAVETCQANAQAKSVMITCLCPAQITAWMQPALLEQAIVNLVDNAIKYGPDGSKVDVSAQVIDRELVIEVRDQGRGIEPAHLPRIFERFYRTDKARSRQMGGTGLGLSIVKHVAEAHGGRVSVESTTGSSSTPSGSVFRIHLPDRQEDPFARTLPSKP